MYSKDLDVLLDKLEKKYNKYLPKDYDRTTFVEKAQGLFNDLIWVPWNTGWFAHFDAMSHVTEINPEITPMQGLAEAGATVLVTLEDVTIVAPPPKEIHLNDNDESHNENGPAVSWTDGWGVYNVNGVRVPKWIIEEPEKITVENIKAEKNNVEVRRIMRERFGEGRYLDQIGAKIIDVDEVFVDRVAGGQSVPRALLEDDEGQRFLVGTDGTTERVYYMPCDPENPPKTCVEAHNSLMPFGNDSNILAQS